MLTGVFGCLLLFCRVPPRVMPNWMLSSIVDGDYAEFSVNTGLIWTIPKSEVRTI